MYLLKAAYDVAIITAVPVCCGQHDVLCASAKGGPCCRAAGWSPPEYDLTCYLCSPFPCMFPHVCSITMRSAGLTLGVSELHSAPLTPEPSHGGEVR